MNEATDGIHVWVFEIIKRGFANNIGVIANDGKTYLFTVCDGLIHDGLQGMNNVKMLQIMMEIKLNYDQIVLNGL